MTRLISPRQIASPSGSLTRSPGLARASIGFTLAFCGMGMALAQSVNPTAETVPAPTPAPTPVPAPAPAPALVPISIYGIFDQGVTRANGGTTDGGMLPGRATPSAWNLKAGNTSRLGFRGKVPLADGQAYGRFQMEHRLALDTGKSSNADTFWLGRSVVALGSDTWGEVYAGREYSAAYWVPLFADPTAWSYVSQLATPYTYANYTAVDSKIEATNNRWSNAVGYKSPAKGLGGVTFELASGLGEGARKRETSGNIQFKRDQSIWVGLAHDRMDAENNVSIAGLGYDFGVIFPTATYSKAKGGTKKDAESKSVSVRVPVSYGRVYASYGVLTPQAKNKDSTMVGLGTEYIMTKQALLYSNVGSAKQDLQTRTTAVDLGVKYTFE